VQVRSLGGKITPVLRALLITASLCVILFFMKWSADILGPIVFALFVAVLITPILYWLQRKGLPTWLALIIMTLGLIVFFGALTLVFYLSLRQIDNRIPFYTEKFTGLQRDVLNFLKGIGIDADIAQVSSGLLDPSTIGSFATRAVTGLLSGLSLSFIILFAIIFTMLEAPYFRQKLTIAFGANNQMLKDFARFSRDSQQFVYLKTINNLIVAVGATIMLFVLRIDFAILWGILIFFLGYIPNIGIVLACVPPTVLALLQHGIISAIIVIVGATIINIVGDNIITPRLMSGGLDLSQFSVFFSFIFWAWVLGAIGALLSVPLTIAVKELLELSPSTRWLAILLGSNKEVEIRHDDGSETKVELEEAPPPPPLMQQGTPNAEHR
jgi:AI-2 transport protein TqsA